MMKRTMTTLIVMITLEMFKLIKYNIKLNSRFIYFFIYSSTMSNCSICLETNKDPFQSKCSHTFCNKCIMEWITQHDDCPLCRNPISDTPTINNYDEDEEEEPRDYYIININHKTLTKEETLAVDNRVDDFIETLDKPLSIYQWKESNEGSWYTAIRKQTYCIDMKIDLIPSYLGSSSTFDNYYNIYVNLHKREFYNTKQNKYKKKQFKLTNSKKSSYLYR